MLDRLTDATILALRCPGSAWPRGLLGGPPIPDAWMGLVETPDGRRRFVPAGEDPRPARDDVLLLVRNRAITVPLELHDAPAACDHGVEARVELLVRPERQETALAALRQNLLTQPELRLDEFAAAVCGPGGAVAALRAYVRSRPAADLVGTDPEPELLAHLQARLGPWLYSAGLTLERVATAAFSSPALEAQRKLQLSTREAAARLEAREAVEQAALTAARRRVEGLSAILDKLRSAAGNDDRAGWQALLPALTPAERGRLLESLWRITPDRHVAAAILAVAGDECLWLDPCDPLRVQRRVQLPPTLGPPRSVCFALDTAGSRSSPAGLVLVGAQSGVLVLDADDGELLAEYPVPGTRELRFGFNRVALSGSRLIATHSELGCWTWTRNRPDSPDALLVPEGGTPRTVRAATFSDDGHMLFAVDSAIRVHAPDGALARTLEISRGGVHDLAVSGEQVYAATADGLLLADRWTAPQVWQVLHRRADPIESLALRRWDDLVELVIPAGEDGVLGVYGDVGIVAQLVATPVRIRRAWACDDLVVGLSEVRDRLVVLNANLPDSVPRQAPTTRLTRHSIQDVCIALRRAANPADAAGESPS